MDFAYGALAGVGGVVVVDELLDCTVEPVGVPPEFGGGAVVVGLVHHLVE